MDRERIVVRKSQVLSTGTDSDAIWTSLFLAVHERLAEGWEILHVDEQDNDLVVSLARQPKG
jgi:hypothetical protein